VKDESSDFGLEPHLSHPRCDRRTKGNLETPRCLVVSTTQFLLLLFVGMLLHETAFAQSPV